MGTGEPMKLSKLLLIFWNMSYKMKIPPDHQTEERR